MSGNSAGHIPVVVFAFLLGAIAALVLLRNRRFKFEIELELEPVETQEDEKADETAREETVSGRELASGDGATNRETA